MAGVKTGSTQGTEVTTHSKNSFRIWKAPNAGSLLIVCTRSDDQHVFHSNQQSDVSAYQVAHDLTCNIAPSDENAPRTHRCPVLNTTASSTHKAFAALVCPGHDVPDRILALGQAVEHGNKFALEELHKVFVAAVAYERGLIPHRLKVDLGLRAAHLHELLLVRQDGVECLGHLVDIQEAH